MISLQELSEGSEVFIEVFEQNAASALAMDIVPARVVKVDTEEERAHVVDEKHVTWQVASDGLFWSAGDAHHAAIVRAEHSFESASHKLRTAEQEVATAKVAVACEVVRSAMHRQGRRTQLGVPDLLLTGAAAFMGEAGLQLTAIAYDDYVRYFTGHNDMIRRILTKFIPGDADLPRVALQLYAPHGLPLRDDRLSGVNYCRYFESTAKLPAPDDRYYVWRAVFIEYGDRFWISTPRIVTI